MAHWSGDLDQLRAWADWLWDGRGEACWDGGTEEPSMLLLMSDDFSVIIVATLSTLAVSCEEGGQC